MPTLITYFLGDFAFGVTANTPETSYHRLYSIKIYMHAATAESLHQIKQLLMSQSGSNSWILNEIKWILH